MTYEFAGWCGEAQYVLEGEPAYTAGLNDGKVLVVGGEIAVLVDTGQWRHRVDCQRNSRHNNEQYGYDRQHLHAIYLFYLFIIHETDTQWAKNVNKRYKIKQYINHRFIGSCRTN